VSRLGASGRVAAFIWLSATVDPTFYYQYLNSSEVLVTQGLHPNLKGKVEVLSTTEEFLTSATSQLMKEARGGVFVPTRAEVEKLAVTLGDSGPSDHGFLSWRRAIGSFVPFLEG